MQQFSHVHWILVHSAHTCTQRKWDCYHSFWIALLYWWIPVDTSLELVHLRWTIFQCICPGNACVVSALREKGQVVRFWFYSRRLLMSETWLYTVPLAWEKEKDQQMPCGVGEEGKQAITITTTTLFKYLISCLLCVESLGKGHRQEGHHYFTSALYPSEQC